MDRLSTLAIGILLATACEDRKTTGSDEPPSRVNAAKTSAKQAVTTDSFCDVHAPTDRTGAVFQWPALAGGVAPPAASPGWRWVNVWATWCKPCVEEMPRLLRWRDQLAASGRKVELAFISVDDSEPDVIAFRNDHPDLPIGMRFADATTSPAWLRELGFTGDPPIPIHVFVSPMGRVRCARAGGVRDQDFAVIEKLFGE